MKRLSLAALAILLSASLLAAGELEDATLQMRHRLGQSLLAEQEMNNQLNQLRYWLNTAQQEEARLKDNLARLMQMRQEINQELPQIMQTEAKLRLDMNQLKNQYHSQLKAIYLYAPDANEWVFAKADDFAEALETRQNLDVLLGARLDSLRLLQVQLAELELNLASLQARQRQMQELAAELKLTQQDLDKLSAQRSQAGQEMAQRQQEQKQNQADLAQAQARLQRASQASLPVITSSQELNTGALEGKGSFYAPVQGQVLDGKNFSLLKTLPANLVRAPWAGVVAYADVVPGYGRLVVIDHGQRLHSVLAHLSQITVRPGQALGAGEGLGNVDDSGLLYVEIRLAAKPQAVRDWLFLGSDVPPTR